MRLSPAAVWLDSRLYKVSSIPPIIRFAAISPNACRAPKWIGRKVQIIIAAVRIR